MAVYCDFFQTICGRKLLKSDLVVEYCGECVVAFMFWRSWNCCLAWQDFYCRSCHFSACPSIPPRAHTRSHTHARARAHTHTHTHTHTTHTHTHTHTAHTHAHTRTRTHTHTRTAFVNLLLSFSFSPLYSATHVVITRLSLSLSLDIQIHLLLWIFPDASLAHLQFYHLLAFIFSQQFSRFFVHCRGQAQVPSALPLRRFHFVFVELQSRAVWVSRIFEFVYVAWGNFFSRNEDCMIIISLKRVLFRLIQKSAPLESSSGTQQEENSMKSRTQ